MKVLKTTMQRLRFVPKMFLLLSVVFLVPLLMLLPFPGERRFAASFLLTSLAAASAAAAVQAGYLLTGRRRAGRQKAVVTVMIFWLSTMALGGLPFLIAGQLRPMQALFESVSGWTTTGFTVLADINAAPRIFLFYRGFMQFCGGLGFVVLLLLFAGGREARGFYSAEGHADMIEPNLMATARATMYIYLGMVAGGTLLYILFGMNWFEAVNHAMSALGTGGFSPMSENIGAYHRISIEAVTIVLMLLGATNFAALALVLKRKWKNFFRLGDIRLFLILLSAFVLLLTFLGVRGVYGSFGESFRNSVFMAVSAITTTGYSVDGIQDWSPAMIYLIFILMFIGGASGSTAGGLKYTRIYILLKAAVHHFRKLFRPERAVQTLTIQGISGKIAISERAVAQHQRVALLYLLTFFAGAFLLTLGGMPIQDAMVDFASSLGTIGISGGQTGPNSSGYVLAVQIVGMVLARMEVYIVYVFAAAGTREVIHSLRRLRKFGRGRAR
ncbi:MAG: TrkH family potassium uptake protein [Oscillospiraceae bacterium]|jgi:trk system potassium uptake protein TrkH|nr:TrkH family potassium uptake protein [Oscillospiraceae bacterium]